MKNHQGSIDSDPIDLQRGYILLPVVLLIALVATAAFLLNNESALDGGITQSVAESAEADYVTRAGLTHAVWGAQNSGCAGDMAMTTVPFGQGSYTATVDAGGPTVTQYTFTPDRDGIIEETTPDHNHADHDIIKVQNAPGDIEQALYHYDLSSIPTNQRVVTATAWFYVDTEDPAGAVTLHPVTADWTEASLTWDAVGGKFESRAYGSFPPQPVPDKWVSVNVTALAQNWVSNPGSNYGFLLNATSVGVQSKYTSREYSTASLRPYLEVTTADAPVSPVSISATGTLTGNPSPASDVTRVLTRTDLPAYQPDSSAILQPGPEGKDAMIYQWKADWNYGSSDSLYVRDWGSDSDYYSLLEFDLGSIPYGATIHSAQLALYQDTTSTAGGSVGVHRITSSWVEGSGNGSNAPGVTWNDRDSGVAWTTPGGDFDAEADASTTIPVGSRDWFTWDITGLVSGWVSGIFPNQGLALVHGSSNAHAQFVSSDATDPTLRPRLTIRYACGCGTPCLAPQGSGNVMMVVVNPTTLVPADAYRKALFESWGYTVNIIGENANAAAYATAATSNDVFYISETVNSSQVGTRIKDVPIGVVSQDGSYNSDLGFATGSAWQV
ncbi:MAG: DNRLRE domain-containing protein, partial [Gammaproteobacteria bacterium]